MDSTMAIFGNKKLQQYGTGTAYLGCLVGCPETSQGGGKIISEVEVVLVLNLGVVGAKNLLRNVLLERIRTKKKLLAKSYLNGTVWVKKNTFLFIHLAAFRQWKIKLVHVG